MSKREVHVLVRRTLPGTQYDYEILSATEEVGEEESYAEAFTRLREEVFTQTTKHKLKEREDGSD